MKLVDGLGNVTDTYTYDVFGAVRSHMGTSGSEFTFTGEQNDPNGIEYLRARYYDPAVGRFLSRDPIPHLNAYVYANNNPVNVIDPSGMGDVGVGYLAPGWRSLCDQWLGARCVGGIGGGSNTGSGAGAGAAALLLFLWLADEISGDGDSQANLASAGGEPAVTPPGNDPNDPWRIRVPRNDENKLHKILDNPEHNWDLAGASREEILGAIEDIANNPARYLGSWDVPGGRLDVYLGGLNGQWVEVRVFVPSSGGPGVVSEAWIPLP